MLAIGTLSKSLTNIREEIPTLQLGNKSERFLHGQCHRKRWKPHCRSTASAPDHAPIGNSPLSECYPSGPVSGGLLLNAAVR